MTVRDLMKQLFDCQNLDADVFLYDLDTGERILIENVDDDGGWVVDLNTERREPVK